jgi:hypothetical protein
MADIKILVAEYPGPLIKGAKPGNSFVKQKLLGIFAARFKRTGLHFYRIRK